MIPAVLPKSHADAAEAIEAALTAAEPLLNVKQVSWQVISRYLEGMREFQSLDYTTGVVTVQHRNRHGDLPLKFEEVLEYTDTQIGRFMRLDIAPHVSRRAFGLDSLRKRSLAQLALSVMNPDHELARVKNEALRTFVQLGTIGLTVFATTDKRRGMLMPRIEVIPPWELAPYPANSSSTQTQGQMRCRWVPLDGLKTLPVFKNITNKAALDAGAVEVPHGTSPSVGNRPEQETRFSGGGSFSASRRRNAKNPSPSQLYVRLVELWLSDGGVHLRRYVVMLGTGTNKKIVVDHQYGADEDKEFASENRSTSTQQRIMPTWVARYHDVGLYYGRGYPELQIPMNHEVEATLQHLFKNMRNWDIYGTTLLPTTWGLTSRLRQLKGRSPAVEHYEPDYGVPHARVERITPTDMGDQPINSIRLGLEMMEKSARQSEMMSGNAPGRVDSARALDLLFEASTIPLSSPSSSLAQAMAGVYMAQLDIVRDGNNGWDAIEVGSLDLIDDSLVGIVLNTETGGVALDEESSIPDPEDVDISIRSKKPISPAQEKQELDEALKKGAITPREYRIMARVKGLDLPVGNEQEWQTYRDAVISNVVLFGDGKTPGTVELDDSHDFVDVRSEVIKTFMARPEFKLASDEVKHAFEAMLEQVEGLRGVYPDEMEYPEDAGVDALQQGLLPPPGQGPGMMAPPELGAMSPPVAGAAR